MQTVIRGEVLGVHQRNRLDRQAASMALQRRELCYVVVMDYHESRRCYVVPSDYVDGDEFEAFSGLVLAVAAPGEPVEWIE